MGNKIRQWANDLDLNWVDAVIVLCTAVVFGAWALSEPANSNNVGWVSDSVTHQSFDNNVRCVCRQS